jgi:hypothetical protein
MREVKHASGKRAGPLTLHHPILGDIDVKAVPVVEPLWSTDA